MIRARGRRRKVLFPSSASSLISPITGEEILTNEESKAVQRKPSRDRQQIIEGSLSQTRSAQEKLGSLSISTAGNSTSQIYSAKAQSGYNPKKKHTRARRDIPDSTIKIKMSSHVPSLFTTLPPLRDLLNTDSSAAQDETVQACLPYLKNEDGYNGGLLNEYGLPPLDREAHAEFLHGSLGAFPAKFVGIDASRPWMVYWALCGLQLLGEDISVYRER